MNSRLIIFAGAGLSAESGLPTFRDADGLWNRHDVNRFCRYSHFLNHKYHTAERSLIFDFYNSFKEATLNAQPHTAHQLIAEWQNLWGPERVIVMTSNIDLLLEKAGCQKVLHVHGSLDHMHCTSCQFQWLVGDALFQECRCPRCHSRLTKPHVVFFGERAPAYTIMHQHLHPKRSHPQDIFLWIGSSMTVIQPETLLKRAHSRFKGITALINKDPHEYDRLFTHRYYGLASELVSRVDQDIIQPVMNGQSLIQQLTPSLK